MAFITLRVTNLPQFLSDEQFSNEFLELNGCSCVRLTRGANGEPVGFLEFTDPQSALMAFQKYNNWQGWGPRGLTIEQISGGGQEDRSGRQAKRPRETYEPQGEGHLVQPAQGTTNLAQMPQQGIPGLAQGLNPQGLAPVQVGGGGLAGMGRTLLQAQGNIGVVQTQAVDTSMTMTNGIKPGTFAPLNSAGLKPNVPKPDLQVLPANLPQFAAQQSAIQVPQMNPLPASGPALIGGLAIQASGGLPVMQGQPQLQNGQPMLGSAMPNGAGVGGGLAGSGVNLLHVNGMGLQNPGGSLMPGNVVLLQQQNQPPTQLQAVQTQPNLQPNVQHNMAGMGLMHQGMANVGPVPVGVAHSATQGIVHSNQSMLDSNQTMVASVQIPMELPADASSTLYIDGLPSDITKRELSHIFRFFDGYQRARIVVKDGVRRDGKVTMGFVDFASPEQATRALNQQQGYPMDLEEKTTATLKISYAKPLKYPQVAIQNAGGGHQRSERRYHHHHNHNHRRNKD